MPLAVVGDWWVYVHLVGVFGFLITHGVSVVVALRLRKERDRARIRGLLQLSGETITLMYVSLVVLIAGGVIAAQQRGMWSLRWIRLSLGLLVVAIAIMIAIARPYYRGIKEAIELRPSGAPRVSDEDLAARLRGWQPHAIATIGFASLLVILWMMVFKQPV